MGKKNSKVTFATDQVEGAIEEPKLEMVLSSTSQLSPVETDLKDGDSDDEKGVGNKNNKSERSQNIGEMIMRPITAVVSPIAIVGEQVVEHTIGYVIPKIEKIPWIHFIFLSLLVAVP